MTPCLMWMSPSASRRHLPTLPFISISPAAFIEKPSSTFPRTITVPRKRMFPVCMSTLPFTSNTGSTFTFPFASTTCPLMVAMTFIPSGDSSVFLPGREIDVPACLLGDHSVGDGPPGLAFGRRHLRGEELSRDDVLDEVEVLEIRPAPFRPPRAGPSCRF